MGRRRWSGGRGQVVGQFGLLMNSSDRLHVSPQEQVGNMRLVVVVTKVNSYKG